MKTPCFTLIEYNTDHGQITAVVRTSQPDTLVFGFTDRESCLSFLRRNRQRRYLQNGEVNEIPILPGHTRYDKEVDAWYNEFLKEIGSFVSAKESKVLCSIKEREIDHCTITDTTELYCLKAENKIVFKKSFHTTWGGSPIITTTEDSPKERLEIIELIRANKDAIVGMLTHNQSIR